MLSFFWSCFVGGWFFILCFFIFSWFNLDFLLICFCWLEFWFEFMIDEVVGSIFGVILLFLNNFVLIVVVEGVILLFSVVFFSKWGVFECLMLSFGFWDMGVLFLMMSSLLLNCFDELFMLWEEGLCLLNDLFFDCWFFLMKLWVFGFILMFFFDCFLMEEKDKFFFWEVCCWMLVLLLEVLLLVFMDVGCLLWNDFFSLSLILGLFVFKFFVGMSIVSSESFEGVI